MSTPPPPIPDNRKLPKKEHDLFRSIHKFFEIKQYKKALKAADTILKKYPSHGETQAMKGLILNIMDKKEEAYDLVKTGLRNDVRSHVCWHVLGILHRSDRNYKEAIKCYLNALRIDRQNMQILRDLSNLQVQMRDLKGFVETKLRMLHENSKVKINWMGYAVANHLVGNLPKAAAVIDAFLATLDNRERGYDESELILYKALILEEAGEREKSLELLEKEKKFVVDGLSWRTQKAELLLMMERYQEAEGCFRGLLEENSENYHYHVGVQCAVLSLPAAVTAEMLKLKGCELPSTELGTLEEGQRQTLLQLYEDLAKTHPKSLAIEKVPLGFLEGEAFALRVDAYMRRHIKRGLPSLGSELAALFTTVDVETGKEKKRAKDGYDLRRNEKFKVVCGLVEGYIDALTKTQNFPVPAHTHTPTQNGTATTKDNEDEPPTTLLWATYLHTQLLEASGDLPKALAQIESCLTHTHTSDPETHIDMLQRKARLLKKAGSLTEASLIMDTARQQDLADRYVNNKTTKYLLRAGKVEEAQGVIALFAKHEGDPQYNLFDMQCMWYELEWAEAMQREAEEASSSTHTHTQSEGEEEDDEEEDKREVVVAALGKALKKYSAVEKHFADFAEDQFDFHTYCVRKMTLRAYVEILRLEDELLAHRYYIHAARGLVVCYLSLLDLPKVEEEGGEVDYSKMTAAERKKEKAKARKAAKKLEAQVEAAAAASKAKAEAAVQAAKLAAEEKKGGEEKEKEKKGGKKQEKEKPVDDDPLGQKLAAKDPLEQAARVIGTLTKHAAKLVSTHVLAYDVAVKRGKALLALQALIRGQALKEEDPEIVYRTVDFVQSLAEKEEGSWAAAAVSNTTIAAVIDAEKAALLGESQDLGGYVDAYVRKAKGWASLEHLLAAAKSVARIRPGETKAAVALVLDGMKGECRGLTVVRLKEALRVVEKELKAGPGVVGELQKVCREKFPLATAFQEEGGKKK